MMRFLVFSVSAWMFANGLTWHSSQIMLRRLYELQNEQFSVVRKYLDLETKRIHNLERTLIQILNWYTDKKSEKNAYILNCINSLQFMKRINNNLVKIENLLNNNQSIEVLTLIDHGVDKTVTEYNIESVCGSLRRIQKAYAITASDIAAGKYNGRIVGDPMDVRECYVMTEYCLNCGDMFGVVDWAIQTYNKWLDGQLKYVNIDNLIYYIKFASMFTGFNFDTLPHFNGLHSHSENSQQISNYMSMMVNEYFIKNTETQSDIYDTYDQFEYYDRCKNFRSLCRTGQSTRPLTVYSKCRYQTKNSPYRLLMPFKEEDISTSPYIKLYHDVLYNGEIETIIDMAEKNGSKIIYIIDLLTDAASYVNGTISVVEERRFAQLKWFTEDSNPKLFDKLNERIECITEFSTKMAEGYQTINYGFGGHFSVHVDAFTDSIKLNGNRLVTVLFYMSDVLDDGYTIFPNLNYVAQCRKGTALVWQNLYLNNGSVHSGTYHGGCPVIKGNKWIMTKGLYERGQHLTYNWEGHKQIVIV